MKYLVYLFAIFLLLSLNLGLFNNLQIKGQIPDLLFLMVLYFALEKEGYDFFFIALVSGLILDFYSSGFFGAYALAFLVLAFSLHIFAANMVVVELNWKTLSVALIFCLLALNIFIWLYGLLALKLNFTGTHSGFKLYISGFPYSLFYNWLLLYPVYLFSGALKRFVDNLSLKRRGVVR
jgi:rod shape-determining protein MreD